MQNLRALTGMFWFDSGGFVVDRRIAIRRLRAKGRAGGGTDRRKQSSRGGARPEMAHRPLRGLIQHEIGSGRQPDACVNHWEELHGLSVAGAEISGGEAALRW